MSGYQDYLQPDDTDLWIGPELRHYRSLVVDTLLSTTKVQSTQVKAAMLCLPSFEPEWLVSIEDEIDHKRKSIEGRHLLRLVEVKPQIWGAFYEVIEEAHSYQEFLEKLRAFTPDIKTHVKMMALETAQVKVLCEVWHAMLRQTKRELTTYIIADGDSFHFMLRHDREELMGKTHSPDDNLKSGQLVAIGKSLRALALADEDQHPLIQADLEKRISKLQRQLGTA